MDLLKGKSIEQVIKQADEALNWTIADQTELISSRDDLLCKHPNPVLISRNGENLLLCRDCGEEGEGFIN